MSNENETAEELELAKEMFLQSWPTCEWNKELPASQERFIRIARVAFAKLRPAPAAPPVPVLTVEEEVVAKLVVPTSDGWLQFADADNTSRVLPCISPEVVADSIRAHFAAQITAKVSGPLREEIAKIRGEKIRAMSERDWANVHNEKLKARVAELETDGQMHRDNAAELEQCKAELEARIAELEAAQAKPAEPSPAAVAVEGGSAGERVLRRIDAPMMSGTYSYLCHEAIADAVNAEVAAAVAPVKAALERAWNNKCLFCEFRYGDCHSIEQFKAAAIKHYKDCPNHPLVAAVAARDAEIKRLTGEIERAREWAGNTHIERSFRKIRDWSFAAADAGTGGVKA